MMEAKNFFLIIVLSTGNACAATPANTTSTTFQNATIVARSEIPPYTGYIRTWVELKVSTKGTNMVMLLPHFEEAKILPEVGDVCLISYHPESVDGQVGDHNVQLASANVIDHLECQKADKGE